MMEEVGLAEDVDGDQGGVPLQRELYKSKALLQVEAMAPALGEHLLALAPRVQHEVHSQPQGPPRHRLGSVDAVAPEPHLADERHAQRRGGGEHAEVDAWELTLPDGARAEAEHAARECEAAVRVQAKNVQLLGRYVRSLYDAHGKVAEDPGPERQVLEGAPRPPEARLGADGEEEPGQVAEEEHEANESNVRKPEPGAGDARWEAQQLQEGEELLRRRRVVVVNEHHRRYDAGQWQSQIDEVEADENREVVEEGPPQRYQRGGRGGGGQQRRS